jgi:hypothetical protein
MKFVLSLLLIFYFISCSNIKLTHRYFECGDTIKVNSLSFVNDSQCIYKQEFLIEMPKEYQRVVTSCNYRIESNKLVLTNQLFEKNLIKSHCHRIPEEILNEVKFFQPDTTHKGYIYPGIPPTFSRMELYGYFDNITIDTMTIKRHYINFKKVNDCFPFYIFITGRFNEKIK